ncbi:MAG: DoxX family protein [Candidatus Sungbacteria bacterium RIFCSPLOWO2_02_FULL_51_17]|uniref:DoxX family protein n=1 Tax=Candidatus Sungbacteria bacterium RIFCSPHIGHO2_02_FULL_51_29 TaxID=1802273 RepID=A0A1G2KXJ2_9BACT|nr:MAG: DoxX family protein [Candidatus Sungbacteria bacterium RIFCSPHIGHO2_01_FULL_51_22]OHA03149.1 MAG: DoxX family protein [Candidatus Sungbacteria bacterium RIFCSPHIGHO2_02_FULL_51_29]OHA04795.1 MAG: DoxX family protein [Candidatus Sungbacteria bacterium RIFCSPLOWO2_01_FULL_51_34]OHA11068.1 MAG: DoxX family protein [Candidatus Sungbacteria bacterium RIFCSPLOWO2_02_FULL_51_17]
MIYAIIAPPFVQKARRVLFSETGPMTWAWLVVRVYVGYEWATAGWHKLNDPLWMDGGTALRGFWERAVTIPQPPARAVITYDVYRQFLQTLLSGDHYIWFAKLIAYGEFFVGIALILGAFVGIAAFFGAFMNFNFMLAGSASTNPVLFVGAVLLMLAWKTAGYWGCDRWLMPRIGTPLGLTIEPARSVARPSLS